MSLEELYHPAILEHHRKPRNRGELKDATFHVHGDNPMCGDQITLYLKLTSEGKVEDIAFTGSGCAISQASASILTVNLKEKTLKEARQILKSFQKMMVESEDDDQDSEFGELKLLKPVRQYPARMVCAELAWNVLRQGLDKV